MSTPEQHTFHDQSKPLVTIFYHDRLLICLVGFPVTPTLNTGSACPHNFVYVRGMYVTVGGMYVVCNHDPGPSALGVPDPRRTVVFVSIVNILIPSTPTSVTVWRTVP